MPFILGEIKVIAVIKEVFKILGVMLASLILWNVLMGEPGRESMWSAMKPAYEDSWNRFTFTNGREIDVELTKVFNEAQDLTTP